MMEKEKITFVDNLRKTEDERRHIEKETILESSSNLHSQDEIVSTFSKIQEETCLKFFMTASNSTRDKILFISNPDKLKTCPPSAYDYSKSVVDRRNTSTLLSQSERDYINTHYNQECSSDEKTIARRSGDEAYETAALTDDNLNYYKDKVWPLGILLYGIDEELRGTTDHNILSHAMATIEVATNVVFQEIKNDKVLAAKSLLWFGKKGEDGPAFGVQDGNQTINLSSMTHGAAGHTAHTINNLMRALGVHMTSNRFDRDNYVTINWNNVLEGKEHYLERAPQESWLHIPYDFASVTHAPANYMCGVCELGASTVQPIQDHQWQRIISMGHKTVLTDADRQTVNLLYSEEYRNRFNGA
ncbi:zinc metalloproteinase nas-14-like [Zerene cesonia]|uniref:zinc metalloproteinase nas-14-like n=1 Tax=Zerene cesonia TaxID=33412 RepID=UPI0018E4EB38|nr:zinc metalloproteinase nas-14-like [Zerene cesonia]